MTVAPPARRRRWQRAAYVVGPLIAVAGAVLVGHVLVDQWDETRLLLVGASPAWLALALVCSMGAMTSIGLNSAEALRMTGGRLAKKAALAVYFLGQLGKYVPGGIWPVLGRAELLRRSAEPGRIAYSATLLSLVTTYAGACVVIALLWPWSATGLGFLSIAVPAVVVLAAATAFVRPALFAPVGRLLARWTANDRFTGAAWPSRIVVLVARHVPAWLLLGASTWAVARSFGLSPGLLDIVVVNTAAWLVGFLTVGAPGGIGVREAVFVALAAGMTSAEAAAVAVASRLVAILVDVCGASWAALTHAADAKRRRRIVSENR